ncbi:MAG: PASTA domain-containing protein, partial [Ruminococcus sp.]|nr:PASTA domain-containing protein [Ruminococcus sp.]
MSERKICYKCMEKYDMSRQVCPNCGYDDSTPNNPMYITPGTILHERYLIGILLRYNGEGATYIGHDMSTSCNVLIREYMPVNLCSRVKNKATISVNYNNLAKYKAFMAEYTELHKSLARLRNNSNINPVLDMFSENNTTYTVFEYIDGMTMMDFLKENAGEISWEQASKLFPQLFTTVGILHNAGIIHRAVSPETVYINKKGELKILGFCVSAERTADAGLEPELFKGYTAPEQYFMNSNNPQNSWTDVYGICALLYRALTGCMPTDAKERMKSDDLLPPDQLNGSIPKHVSRVIMDGMNLSGKNRIQTVTELVTRLFEQPAPVKTAKPPQSYPKQNTYPQNPYPQQYQQPYQHPYQQPYPQQYPQYQNPQQYTRQPVRNQGDEEYDNYKLEKVNTVDRIKVPVLIGILLFLILFIISVVIVHMVTPAKNQKSNISSQKKTSVSDNIVTGDSEESETSVPAPEVEVPDLVGKFYQLVQTKYGSDFTFESTYEYNDVYESDMIFAQDTQAGTKVAKDSVIKLKISKGKDNTKIPEYADMNVKQYEIKLKEAGISNYSLISSTEVWGNPNTVVMLKVDGKEKKVGDEFSNSSGKKLEVYYYPPDDNSANQENYSYDNSYDNNYYYDITPDYSYTPVPDNSASVVDNSGGSVVDNGGGVVDNGGGVVDNGGGVVDNGGGVVDNGGGVVDNGGGGDSGGYIVDGGGGVDNGGGGVVDGGGGVVDGGGAVDGGGVVDG